MDSRVASKLIRSEIWPILRRQGFTKLNARNAWRYRQPLIDVVNFQSFNSYLAEGIGCTTYSFGVNLGVYVQDGLDSQVKRNKAGRLLPHEAECAYRVQLKKRKPIDLCAREDVFYIDAEVAAGSCWRGKRPAPAHGSRDSPNNIAAQGGCRDAV